MTTDRRVIQSRSALVIFAISVCKIPVRKGDPHGDRKERKGRNDHGSKVSVRLTAEAVDGLISGLSRLSSGAPNAWGEFINPVDREVG
jgi:hypothetical protein